MSRYPGATWRGPVPNVGGAMTDHRLFVVHIQDGSEAGTDAWIHNPAAQVSAHFGNPKTGGPDQWVDTGQVAWAEAAYNGVGISIENEGHSGESLTASQVENAAQILAWAHGVHGVKLQVTDDPGGEGVIGHGLLGAAGGGHYDCPGPPILAQRQAIVNRAARIVAAASVPTHTVTARRENDMHADLQLGKAVVFTNPGAVTMQAAALLLASDFGDATVRVALFEGGGWSVKQYPVGRTSGAVKVALPPSVNKASVELTAGGGTVGLDVLA